LRRSGAGASLTRVNIRIAIVGGGVMGASAALHLAESGRFAAGEVALYERRELGAGSSGRSGAILRCHYADREVASMARDSLEWYANFAAKYGADIGYTRCGVATIAGAAQAEWRARVEANTRLLVELGVDARLVDGRGLRELVPGIAIEDGALACWEPNGSFVDPLTTVRALGEQARRRGVEFRMLESATRLWIERGRVRGIECGARRVEAERVLVAAGPWSKPLFDGAGIELPLSVVRPEQVFVRMLEPARGASVPHPILIDLAAGFYTRCEPRLGRTRASFIDYARDQLVRDPDRLDEVIDAASVREVRGLLESRLPAYSPQPDAGWQAAWYTLTPDAQPLLGALEECAGLYVATGFSGHGFKLAPSVGAGLAQLLTDRACSAFDARFFRPRRFESGERAAGGAFGL
jgi:glycine/D-amino acid oxidase-like deaminating enzyme